MPLTETLLQQSEPLYAVLDGARDEAILPLLDEAGAEPLPLLQETKAEALAEYGPQLVPLDHRPQLLDRLVHRGWGRSWGLYLTSPSPQARLASHLRGQCWTQDPSGRRLFFRWYDPRVLRTTLAAMSGHGLDAFLGPVASLLLESAEPARLLCWARGQAGVGHRQLAVVVPDRPAGASA